MPEVGMTLDDIRELCKQSYLHYIGWHGRMEQELPNAPKLTHGMMGITELAGRLAISLELIAEDGLEGFQYGLCKIYLEALKDA